MDSSNPFNRRSNFMDLLNSQEDTNISENPSFDHFPQSIPGSSHQIPQFNSQAAETPTHDQEDRNVRKRWSKTEDLVLISSWLNTSKDTIVSNEQKGKAFWNRIGALYNGSPSIPVDERRESNHCKQRWRKINDQVSKFCGAYASANSQPKSGFADKDYLKLAHEIFWSDYKAKFMLEHAWNELKNEQKWCEIWSNKSGDGGSSKKRKLDDGTGQSESSQSVNNVGEGSAQYVEVRPPGVKAAKGNTKRAGTKSATNKELEQKLDNIKTLWEIKQQDAVIKAKLSDKSMLESLLARTRSEPLSELELALKNKLISDMLSMP